MAKNAWVATRKGLFRFRRRGQGWAAGAPSFIGEPVSAVLSDSRTGRVYAALRLGHFGVKLHRSEDGGTSWKEMAPPAFAKVAEAEKKDGDAKGPSVDMIWTMAAGGAAEPDTLWAGTTPGGLFRSIDGGATWNLVQSLWDRPERAKWMGGGYDQPGIHSVLVDPRDARRITVGVSVGGIWKSDDGATSWRLIGQGMRNEYAPPDLQRDPATQDVHRLATPAINPDVVWVQHHNGIFRSTDAAENFREIKKVAPSTFGFVVAAHPHDADTAWFVPAVRDVQRIAVDGKLVVTRTRDGGRTFTAFGNGLPKKDCYDLIYRHGLAIDDEGETLAMGSTTGNFWIGERGGTRWTNVAGNLPPIAAVAWG